MPIGLLKIATFFKAQGNRIRLIRGKPSCVEEEADIKKFNPDEVWITSLFTYWAKYVRESVQTYRTMFPKAHIKVGGVYASLFPPEEIIEYTGCDEVYQGVIAEVEEYTKTHLPAYDLVNNSHPIKKFSDNPSIKEIL